MTRRYHHGSLRTAIVVAAREKLRLSPAAPLSLRELAREAGVSPNAPYRHFPGKDGVEVALVAEGYRELTRLAEAATVARRPIRSLVGAFAQFAATEAPLLSLVNAERFAGRDPASEAALARDEWFAALVAVVEAEAGELPAHESYRRAAGVWAILLGVTALRAHGARGLLVEELIPDAESLARSIARGS